MYLCFKSPIRTCHLQKQSTKICSLFYFESKINKVVEYSEFFTSVTFACLVISKRGFFLYDKYLFNLQLIQNTVSDCRIAEPVALAIELQQSSFQQISVTLLRTFVKFAHITCCKNVKTLKLNCWLFFHFLGV